MSKHEEKFKLKVVKQYLAGEAGFKTVANRHGINDSMVRRWVLSYQRHGITGLRKKSAQYDARFKLSVLKRMWRNALSYGQTATLFDIRSADHISRWERQYHAGGIDALAPRPRGRPKKMPDTPAPAPGQPVAESAAEDLRTREQLLKENEYLRAEVAYLKKLDALIQAKRPTPRKKRK